MFIPTVAVFFFLGFAEVLSLCAHAQDKLNRDPLIEKLLYSTTGGQKLQRDPLTWKIWAAEVRFKNIQEENVDIKSYSTATA